MERDLADSTQMLQELETLRKRVAELESALADRDKSVPPPCASASAQNGIPEGLLLRALLEDLPDHIYFKDKQSRFLKVSRLQAEKFELQNPADCIGKDDFDYFTTEHAVQAFEDEQEIIRTGQSKIAYLERETWPDGSCTWASTTKLPLRDDEGNIIGTFGLTRDVTHIKHIEQKLEEERTMLRTLIDCLPEYIYFKDRAGHYIAVNTPFLYLVGVASQEDVIGKTVFDLYTPEMADQFAQADQEVFDSGKPYVNMSEKRIMSDGKEHYLMVNKVPLFDSDGQVIGMVGASHDVTLLNQTTRKLEKYAAELDEANVELKKFTYIVSHDLRAPLVNLKGFSMELKSALDVIRRVTTELIPQLDPDTREEAERALNTDVPEALEFINSSVSRMDGFINALLLLSRLGHRDLKLEQLDSNELVSTTLKTLAHQIEQRKITVAADPLPELFADKISMEQIWANLLNNAIVYMRPGQPGMIHVGGHRDEEETVFFVQDNGRGIRAEDMDKVFAPFRRAGKQDVPGEGMGLSYVQTLVRRHGGSIRCESQEGVGTRFIFTIRHHIEKGHPRE